MKRQRYCRGENTVFLAIRHYPHHRSAKIILIEWFAEKLLIARFISSQHTKMILCQFLEMIHIEECEVPRNQSAAFFTADPSIR
jgi:hypothetical protein